jgi:hypothetical protein
MRASADVLMIQKRRGFAMRDDSNAREIRPDVPRAAIAMRLIQGGGDHRSSPKSARISVATKRTAHLRPFATL